MARTIGQVVASARAIVQDVRPPYRYTDNDLAGYVAEALTEARRVRPDLFIGSLRAAVPVYTASDFDTNIPLPDSYFGQIVNYVAGRVDLREDSFSQDGRALTLIQAFGVSLTGGAR